MLAHGQPDTDRVFTRVSIFDHIGLAFESREFDDWDSLLNLGGKFINKF